MDSTKHYENFPVASFFLPKKIREAVAAIYAFARSADDFADEGVLSVPDRLALLDNYSIELDAMLHGQPTQHPIFLRLRLAVDKHGLPIQPFHDLLSAFKQDVTKTRYANFAELLNYCKHSANPVGLLLLHLFDSVTPENRHASDCICTALQLINHWQDVAIDIKKPRIYLPQDDMVRFGVTEEQIFSGATDDNWRNLMRFEVGRARALMNEGTMLGNVLPGRIGLEMRAIIAGGLRTGN